MRYTTLATDYDGTIAHDGVVDDATIAALIRAREKNLRLLMVTGRELDDLLRTFAHIELFERVVAENGALLYNPGDQSTRALAPAPPSEMVEALQQLSIPISVGRSVVATVEPHEHAVLEVIHRLGLEWHIIFNKGSVMVLPSGVNKATGLSACLTELGLPAEQIIGVGDAENDQAFLQKCGLAVAVANALPAVKESADLVTSGARGDGVQQLIELMLADNQPDLSSIKGDGSRTRVVD